MITPKPNFKSSVLKLFIEVNYIVCKNYMFTNCYYGFVFILHHRSDKHLDENNTFQTYVPIYLSTTIDDEKHIEVTISTMNRISLKVNDKLYTKYKY